MSDQDTLRLLARIEHIADVVEPRLTGFYAAVATTAVITIMPAIAGALGRIFS
jgi:hypothetical protein